MKQTQIRVQDDHLRRLKAIKKQAMGFESISNLANMAIWQGLPKVEEYFGVKRK